MLNYEYSPRSMWGAQRMHRETSRGVFMELDGIKMNMKCLGEDAIV